MIEISNFSKSYNTVRVYENFNLSFEEGKITCILGASGCGKTTLLNAVAGLIDYKGTIPKHTCSYVFQSSHLVPNLTVADNLKLVCKDDTAISEMLAKVRLEDKADKYPITLSGGEAQRVAIARAFLFQSDIILMDEPFSLLDLKLKNEMSHLFCEIWEKDKRTALFVTHDIDEALSVAHRIVVLNNGRIVFDNPVSKEPPRDIGYAEDLRRKLISVLLQ